MKQQIVRDDFISTTFDRYDRGEDHVADLVAQDAVKATKAYMQVVEDWGLTDSDAEKMLAVDCRTWVQIKSGTWNGSLNQEQLKRIDALIAIHDVLRTCFDEEEADRWATVPNRLPMFHMRKPVDAMIEEGLPMMEKARRLTDGLLAGM